MKRGLGINREVLLCDLERAKISIQSTLIGIIPTKLKVLRDEYRRYIAKYYKYRYVSSYVIDHNGSKIIDHDAVVLMENMKPVS